MSNRSKKIKYTLVDSRGVDIELKDEGRPRFGTRPTYKETRDMLSRIEALTQDEEERALIFDKYIPACDALLCVIPYPIGEEEEENDRRKTIITTLLEHTWNIPENKFKDAEPQTVWDSIIDDCDDEEVRIWFYKKVGVSDIAKVFDAVKEFCMAPNATISSLLDMRMIDRAVEPTYRCKYQSTDDFTVNNLGHHALKQGKADDGEKEEDVRNEFVCSNGGDEWGKDI